MAQFRSHRILFITSSRIGDAVLSSGVLARLCGELPDARITVACGEVAAPLFADLPQLERLHVMRRRGKGAHWWDLWRAAVGIHWDVVADLRGSALAWMVFARRRLVYRAERRREHRVDEIGRVMKLGASPKPTLWVSADRQARVDKLIGVGAPILAVAPTANWRAKQWPAERFASAVGQLVGEDGILPDARVAVLGAPWEREMAAPVLSAVSPDRLIDLTGIDDLLDVYATLRRSAFFLGNDSGLMHMAAAAGIPTLGLFGPSPDWRYGPYGAHCAVVRTKESFEELVSENPAFDHRRQDCLMTSLEIADVVASAKKLWKNIMVQ